MKELLYHHKAVIALQADRSKWNSKQKQKESEIKEQAYDLMFLHLADIVISKVDGMDTPFDLQNKFDYLFSVISAPNLVFLKGMFF